MRDTTREKTPEVMPRGGFSIGLPVPEGSEEFTG